MGNMELEPLIAVPVFIHARKPVASGELKKEGRGRIEIHEKKQ